MFFIVYGAFGALSIIFAFFFSVHTGIGVHPYFSTGLNESNFQVKQVNVNTKVGCLGYFALFLMTQQDAFACSQIGDSR
jgi:hypothetical protein